MIKEILGTIMIVIGAFILSVIICLFYYLNAIGIWLSETFGASGDAGVGIQLVVLVLGILLLFSAIVFGLALMTIGIILLTDIAPTLLKATSNKFFEKTFDDRMFRT